MYKIIIVDDETLALEQIVSTVNWEALGFEVYGVFDDGAEAIKCLKNQKIDLVLTDIRMPESFGKANRSIKRGFRFFRKFTAHYIFSLVFLYFIRNGSYGDIQLFLC